MRRLCIVLVLLINCAFAQKLRIATYQYADNPRIKNLEPLAAHIQEKLGIPTEVKSYPTVEGFIEAIQKNEVDLAFINTFGYLLLEASNKKYPMIPSVVMITPDTIKANYKTALIASATSPVQNWSDVKKYAGQSRLALVFAGSTSGNLVPRLGLTNIGIIQAEQSFKQVIYTGTHARAINHVLSDSADLGAMGSAEYDKLPAQQQQRLRLIWLSPEIPLGPALININLKTKVRQQLVEELLILHQSNNPAFNSLKAAWSESRTAEKFISIGKNYYQPFLDGFGTKEQIYPILKQFTN